MTLSEIKTAMLAWETARSNASELIEKFSQGNGFSVPTDFEVKGSYVHSYPGIYEGELTFFLINAEDDIEANQSSLADFITICPITEFEIDLKPTDETEITTKEALRRIGNWKTTGNDWISSHAGEGFFQAFLVPMGDYVENNVHSTFFALAGAKGNFSADLITRDETTGKVTLTSFHDMVRPVPPFGGTGTPSSQGSFYLLSLI